MVLPNDSLKSLSGSRRLLVGGICAHLILPVLSLFKRAGFEIDLVALGTSLSSHPAIASYVSVSAPDELPRHLAHQFSQRCYELVIVSDDETLRLIKDSDLDFTMKLNLLPILDSTSMNHIGSKIGLSESLSTSLLLKSPAYRVIDSCDDLLPACVELGFPVILKGDYSAGGSQTHKILNLHDIDQICRNYSHYPAVLQAYIPGGLVGIEAFYQRGQLIFYHLARVIGTTGGKEFTPSSVRIYDTCDLLDPIVQAELIELGRVLGANGFCNITAIENGCAAERFYIEADMRPTVWVDYGRFMGFDPSSKINDYFSNANNFIFQTNQIVRSQKYQMAYPIRLGFWRTLLNHYDSWHILSLDPDLRRLAFRSWRHQLLAIINLRVLRTVLKEQLRKFMKHRFWSFT